jgi:hypothetical protein
MKEDHLLQRRVFAASEPFERQREKSAWITREDLTVYFVKDALRIAMKHSSFQVLGSVGRVLHGYRTREVMKMYSTIAPNRPKNDDQCREWKKEVMDYLEVRFGRYLSTTVGSRNEKRFATTDDCRLLALARSCLGWFIPCHTPHVVPGDCGETGPDVFNYQGPADGEHEIELLRFHAAICPECLRHLAAAWKFDSPDNCFEIPTFEIPPQLISDDDYGDRGQPPQLDDATVDSALDDIAAENERHQTVAPSKLRIRVDGVDVSGLDLESGRVELKVSVDQEVVTIVSETGEVLITHLLTFGDEDFGGPTTTSYELSDFELVFVEQQGVRSGVRVLEVKPRRTWQMARSCATAVSHPVVVSSSGTVRKALGRILHICDGAHRLVIGLGRTGYAMLSALRKSSQPWAYTSASKQSVDRPQFVSIAELRKRLEEIDRLSLNEERLYLQYRDLAHKHSIEAEPVPHVDRLESRLSRLSLLAGVVLSVIAVGLLSIREPLGAIGLAPVITAAILGWRYLRWSRRLTSKYDLTRTTLESLQRDIWLPSDPIASWHAVFRRTSKLAVLFGESEVHSLATVLKLRGYQIEILDPRLSAIETILKRRLDSISNAERSTCLFYFSGHGDYEVLARRLRDAAVSSSWSHARLLYSDCFDVLRKARSESPLLFVGEACSIASSWSGLSVFVDERFRLRAKRRQHHNELLREACANALAEAFCGAAAGQEGLITLSDIEKYVRGRFHDPAFVKNSVGARVHARYSDERCKEVLLSAMPAATEFQIFSPRANSVVPGQMVGVSGAGADPAGTIEVEVLTNDWYPQTGRARVNADGTWTYSPVFLSGQGPFNNHTIKATIVKDGRRGRSVSVGGIVRKQ